MKLFDETFYRACGQYSGNKSISQVKVSVSHIDQITPRNY
jgi:hypothetical protein